MVFLKGLAQEILTIIDKMYYSGEKISYYSVCEKAQVSRKTLYNHPEIAEKISYYRKFNSLGIDERISVLKNENAKLQTQLHDYENLVIDCLCNCNKAP